MRDKLPIKNDVYSVFRPSMYVRIQRGLHCMGYVFSSTGKTNLDSLPVRIIESLCFFVSLQRGTSASTVYATISVTVTTPFVVTRI